ncbi:MAG TPA: alpha/beta hydrolase [Polyangiales bacterium]|nr:alpha/beta hydrolase [Polyangiales bacterium]
MALPTFLTQRVEALEHAVAKRVLQVAERLPAALLQPLSRVADGAVLHPEIALLLGLQRLLGVRQLSAGDVKAARRHLLRDARVHSGTPIPVGAVHELTYPAATGPQRARHYVPRNPERAPLLVFFHGGGFALGDLDTHDAPCRALCAEGNLHVLSVEYRLAPEAPFPAGLDDAYAAFRWAQQNAERLGADPRRIAIGGDSAGGNLAAVITLLAKERGDPLPALQLLLYPAVDSTRDSASIDSFAEGLFLSRADIHWFRDAYIGAHDRSDWRVSPLLAKDLSGLPPAIVLSAGFDPLRDEGEAYARALEAAGNRVVLKRFPQLIHGFINLGALSAHARASLGDVAKLVRQQLTSS